MRIWLAIGKRSSRILLPRHHRPLSGIRDVYSHVGQKKQIDAIWSLPGYKVLRCGLGHNLWGRSTEAALAKTRCRKLENVKGSHPNSGDNRLWIIALTSDAVSHTSLRTRGF